MMKEYLDVSFNASVLAVADYYSSLGVFGETEEKTAWSNVVALGKQIISAVVFFILDGAEFCTVSLL